VNEEVEGRRDVRLRLRLGYVGVIVIGFGWNVGGLDRDLVCRWLLGRLDR